jgi:tetratricopeptide (TPR) repeat protein
LRKAFAAREFKNAAIYLALLILATISVAWPQRDRSLWALDAYNSGWQALESHNLEVAETKLALAHAYVPDNSETLFALGNLRLAQGEREVSKSFYQAVLLIDPKHKGALNNLGVIAFEAGNFEQAGMFFERALVQAPRDAKTYYLLARTFLAESNRPAATSAIEKAIKLNPAQPEFAALREEIYKSKQ